MGPAERQELGIEYVIWNQQIWNIQRDAEGWRYMADRGGDSANHKNHVHITVYWAIPRKPSPFDGRRATSCALGCC